MEFIRLIFKNTLRNPRRTVLTILSIGVSLFLVSTLQAVLNSLYRAGHSSSNPHLRVVVHRATSITQSLPEADRARIAEVPGVKYVIGVTWFGGQQAAQGLRISKSAGFVWKPREKPQTSWKTEVCATCFRAIAVGKLRGGALDSPLPLDGHQLLRLSPPVVATPEAFCEL